MRFAWIFTLLLLYVSHSFSQNGKHISSESFTYQYLTTKEGLSNQRVFCILEDKKGFIWISTKSGIDCFDGRNVRNYNLSGEDIIVDETGRIIYLTKDNHSTIWAYTSAGKIFRYDALADTFTMDLDLNQIMENGIFLNYLYIDSQNNFWLGLQNGLFCYNAASGIQPIMKEKCINFIEYSPADHSFYIASTEGVHRLHVASEKSKSSIDTILSNINVQSTFYDPATSRLWIGTFNAGVIIMNPQTGLFEQSEALHRLPSLPYRAITAYSSHTILLGIDGAGVYAIDRNNYAAQPFINANQEEDGRLKGNGVYAIYKDSASNLWIGSYTGGVVLANPKQYLFDLIQHEYKNPQSLTNSHVNAVLEDKDGDLWYATNQGISVYFTKQRTWKHFLKESVLLTLCNDASGNVWTGGYGTGAYCLNKQTGIIRHITAEQPGGLTTNYIYSIVKDKDDELWFGGTYGNLVRYTPPGKQRKEAFHYYDITLINSIAVVNKDTISLATANGFYLLNKHNGDSKHYFSAPSLLGIKSNSFIYSMYFQSPTQVWFGTDGGGINFFDIKTQKAITYSTADGLPSNYVYGILPDKKGRLWLSTDKGIAYINPTKLPEITNIGFLDGLANEFNFMSFAQLKNGDFIFGSTNGAVRFNPDHFTRHTYKAPLVFTSFEVPQKSQALTQEKKAVFNRMLSQGETIRLTYSENSFLVSFISVSYHYQKDIQYSYLLEGFDKDWSSPSHELSVRYTNVPPGDYVFKVRSMSKNGRHQLDEQDIKIHVALPYWNTFGAWLLYVALLAGITYFVWRFFADKMEKKHFSEKIQFFINTAHDIRTPVTLIMAPLSDLSKENSLSEDGKKYLQIARKNTEKLYNLISQLLDFQKIDTTHTTLRISGYDYKTYLQEKVISFRPLCDSKQITIHVSLPDDPLSLWFDKDKMDKIFDNLLSNAIKYTPCGGEIVIKVQQNEKKIITGIKDNGIGIPRKAQRYIFSNFYRAENAINSKETGSGIGLLLTRRLIKLHKGKISFSSSEGEGTIFQITFRKGSEHLSKYVVSQHSFLSEPETNSLSLINDIAETEQPKEAGNSKVRIMIVEDNDELRFYLKKTFDREYCVIDMPDGESALEYLKSQSVELIISDVMMPGIQGDELCRKLKSDFTTSHIPVILLTAKTEKDSILEGLESGADDYLTKPFDTEILKTKLKGVLHNRRIMREHFLSRTLDTPGNQEVEEECLNLVSPMDKEFLDHCTALVNENLANVDFSINILCRELAMSRTLFYEKLKSLTGQAPNEFIKLMRMKEAATLLQNNVPVQDVAARVGFTDAKYFSTAFKKHYGVSPSKFL